MLGHIVLSKGLEVDKAEIEVIQNLPLPGAVRDLRSFLGHFGYYRRFIQDFAKVSKPLITLLCKDKDFIIDEEGKRTFTMLKQALIEALITCIYNLNSYLISLTFMLILCNYDACYHNFMNFLHWYAITLKFIFMHKLGIIICLIDDESS